MPVLLFRVIIVLLLSVAANAALYSWGYNGRYQLGDGTVTQRTTPVEITSFREKAILLIANAYQSSLVYCNDRRLYAWGYNDFGNLGHGHIATYVSTPTSVATMEGKTITLLGAYYYLTIVVADGVMYTAGRDLNGQLGQGTGSSDDYRLFNPVINGTKSWTHVATGYAYSSMAVADGKLYVWGANTYYLMGPTLAATTYMPTEMPEFYNKVVTLIAMGHYHSLAVADGDLYGWGKGGNYQLGTGCTGVYCFPAVVTTLSGMTITSISAGYEASVAIADGKVYTWGYGTYGQMGDGSTAANSVPTEVPSFSGMTISFVAASYYTVLAVADGNLYSWGDSQYGVIGTGATSGYYSTPVQITSLNGISNYNKLSGNYFMFMLSTTYTYGALYGDPHFRPPAGGVYTITGVPGRIYNIISTDSFQWNMQMVARRGSISKGTYAGPCGFIVGNHTVIADASNASILIDNRSYDNDHYSPGYAFMLGHPAYVVRLYRGSIVVKAPCFRVFLFRAKKGIRTKDAKNVVRAHFDFKVTPASGENCHHVHGAFGQTWDRKSPVHAMGINGEGVIEGDLNDYLEPSLLSVQSKHAMGKSLQ
eukprot:NODE_781_length_2097_cov_120.203647_g743_i0.p1 GENE.NODE_781_length_2097_cov_120.203647_g743_i0~~NODE_781_length_2097_cov_120.203647_g743_i0.p1  ORF type:complete len:609 (+),score=87.96 NODE_781_length_2097_cov_120.203647_g743_i0:52-1827(+)